MGTWQARRTGAKRLLMNRDASHPLCGRGQASGFTLLEILIVGALIALFAGLAIIATQQFYDDNRRKAMFDETKTIGTALSFAHDDINFFPRLNLLARSNQQVVRSSGGVVQAIRPSFDMYGILGEISPFSAEVSKDWRGPYVGQSEARVRISQGSKGLTKMRLTDISQSAVTAWRQSVGIDDISLVDWPTDTWGNPYVVYLVVSEPNPSNSSNPQGLRLINRPGEPGSYLTAVVSYGRNGVPGGTDPTMVQADSVGVTTAWINAMRQARLFVILNQIGIEPDSFDDPAAAHALRCYFPVTRQNQTSFNASFTQAFPYSITNTANPGDPLRPGILDSGSDDIVWRF